MAIQKINTPQAGVWLEVDLDDAATPVLVCGKVKGELMTSTYDCAIGTGFVDDVIELQAKTLVWLEKQSDMVESAIAKAREGHPDYE
jgi:hypothetical protein